MDLSNLPNRFSLAMANATCISLVLNLVLNLACVIGLFFSFLMNNPNLLEFLFPRDFWLSLSLRTAEPVMRSLSPSFFFVWILLVSIFAPVLICLASTKFGRQEKSVGLSDLLARARKLGLLSALLTGAVVVPTVMYFNVVFANWSIVYFWARIWLVPLVYLLALTVVQLILRSENEFVLPEFCSISKTEGSRNPGLICIVSFFVAISPLIGGCFFTPSYLALLVRDSAIYLFLFELIAWLLAGLWLVRIMNRENFMLVYLFCFVVPSLVSLTVLPVLMQIISVH